MKLGQVRRTTWAALALLLLGLLLAWMGQASGQPVLSGLAGAALVVALVLWLLRFLPRPQPHSGVAFRRPGSRERWCTHCGQPAPLGKPCASCGNVSLSMRRNARRLQRKQRPPAQEKKTKN